MGVDPTGPVKGRVLEEAPEHERPAMKVVVKQYLDLLLGRRVGPKSVPKVVPVVPLELL